MEELIKHHFKEIHMKKIISIALLILTCFAFVACDIAAQLEAISSQIYEIATGMGGEYLKETTSTTQKPVSSSSSSSSDEDEDSESSSEPEPEPEKPVIPVRVPATVDQMLGMNVNFDIKSDKGSLALNNPYVLARHRVTHLGGSLVNEDSIRTLEYAQINLKAKTILSWKADFSAIANEEDRNEVDKKTVEMARALLNYYNEYSSPNGANIRRIESGYHADKTLKAADYAKILNYAYDGNRGLVSDLGMNYLYYGSEAKVSVGPLSQPSMMYMWNVLDTIAQMRGESSNNLLAVSTVSTDAFLPSNVTPESQYTSANNELVKMVNLRDTSFKHIEIFVSAFGYNTIDTESEYYVTEQRQADYLVRSYLLFAGLGIDNASVCQYKDVEGSEYHGFGVLNQYENPKIAQYYLWGMGRVLSGYTFSDRVENQDGAFVYKFTNENGDIIYAVWNGVDDGTTISGVKLQTEENNVRLINLPNNGYVSGIETRLIADEDGFVSVDAGETPVFVKVTAPEPEPEAPNRELVTLDKMMGVYLNFTLENKNTNILCVNNPFGAMTILGTHDTSLNSISVVGGRISIARGTYKAEPSLSLAINLANVKELNPENTAGIKTYTQIAKLLKDTQTSQGNSMVAGVYRLSLGKNPDLLMSAQEYAKLVSLSYDGNRGEVSSTGVMSSNYASQSKLYTGSFSAPNSGYMSDMLDALKLLRGRNTILALSGINTDAFAPSSATPESFYLDDNSELLKMLKLRNESYNHIEIDISGFGYTTKDTESDYYATEQMQANYLVRSYLIFASIGVDRASICQYKDAEGEEYDGFGTLNADGTEKLAQFYLATMSKTLGGYKFAEAVENDKGAYIYKFTNETGEQIFAIWNATDADEVITGVEIELADETEAQLISLTNSYEVTPTDLTKNEGKVTVDAGATPVFVKIVGADTQE